MKDGGFLPYDVIIPVKNGARYVLDAIESCLQQTKKPCHIYVIENHSEDNTFQLVSDYIIANSLNLCVKLTRSPGVGVSMARNFGISISHAPILAFLDSDDIWEKDKMELQIPLLRKYSLVHGGSTVVDEENNQLRIEMPKESSSFSAIYELDYPVSGSASSVICLRKELEKIHGFDEKLDLAEDLDLWIRLSSLRGFGAVYKPIVRIRVHENRTQSLSRNIEFKLREINSILYVLAKNQEIYPDVNFPYSKVVTWYVLDTRFNLKFLWLLQRNFRSSYLGFQITNSRLISVYFGSLNFILFKKFRILRLIRRIFLKLLIILKIREYGDVVKDGS
jgi:glycosyltransferase involved in cell wall biosynthesis